MPVKIYVILRDVHESIFYIVSHILNFELQEFSASVISDFHLVTFDVQNMKYIKPVLPQDFLNSQDWKRPSCWASSTSQQCEINNMHEKKNQRISTNENEGTLSRQRISAEFDDAPPYR